MRSPRTIWIGLVVLALVASACTAGKPATSPANTAAGMAAGTPAPTTAAAPNVASSALPTASPDAWLAVGHRGASGLEVILASTREKMFDLPTGVPAVDDWGRIFTAAPAGGKTTIRDVAVQPGMPGPKVDIDGTWQLPTLGPDPLPVGLSSDGSTLILVEASPPAGSATSATTRFAVLSAVPLEGPARIITLRGRFDYDAVSPDGSTLYVVQHLDANEGGRYQVRSVSAATGEMAEGVIADKRNIEEQMAGYPLAQVRRPDGLVLTLYQGTEFAFIHALNTVEGWAVCIDLPASGLDDAKAAADWGLASSPDGGSVYAVNATLGLIADVDPAQLGLRRSASVRPLAGSGIVLAKFGHQESGPTGRRVIVGPDGKAVYAAGAGGILALDASTLKVTATFAEETPVDALAVTPDGGTLYALLRDGHIVRIDAATATILGTVPGDGYDRLVAVVPW
jgi:DNA-binding beta-propeller fold protein YncE